MNRYEYKRLSRQGKRLIGTRICIDWARSSKGTRLGITASTHYGNAPERNRFKRLVREAFRLSRGQISSGIDLNVIPRKLAKDAVFADIKAELCCMLSNLSFELNTTRNQTKPHDPKTKAAANGALC